MLIPQDKVRELLGHLRITGVLHVGAHECEELEFYTTLGVESRNVYWVDAMDNKVQEAKARGIPNVFQAVVSDKEDDTVTFNVTNNVQSSSILEFGTHAKNYTWCVVTEKKTMTTTRLINFVQRNNVPIQTLNLWNFDIQGAELMALRGAGSMIQYADALYLEVNTEEVYKGCPLVEDIDKYVADYGFVRINTLMDPSGWGDALYIRVPKLSLCITTMDRWSFLQETLPVYLRYPFIDEIVISDENGNDEKRIRELYGANPKLRLFTNTKRLGAFLNKRAAVSYARNDWVCLLDSDNFAHARYFEAALPIVKDTSVVYMPSRLLPYKGIDTFDHRKFIGTDITRATASLKVEGAEVLFQTGNYIVNKDLFLKATPSYGLENQCRGQDALYTTYLLLEAGGRLHVVPKMEYNHCVHNGSITIQSMQGDFQVNKILYENLYGGNNPWTMTLRHWMAIAKPLSQWLVNCSEYDRQEDGMVSFPIGMSYQIVKYTGDCSVLVEKGSHSKLVLCAIYPTTDSRRRPVGGKNRMSILQTLMALGIQNDFISYTQYIEGLKDYMFVISPEGNGIDTHRTYEALMAGCVPIVEADANIVSKYSGLPVLYTYDYSEISPSYLLENWNRMLDTVYDFSPLFLSYYDTAIQAQIRSNSNYWCNRTAGVVWDYE